MWWVRENDSDAKKYQVVFLADRVLGHMGWALPDEFYHITLLYHFSLEADTNGISLLFNDIILRRWELENQETILTFFEEENIEIIEDQTVLDLINYHKAWIKHETY